MMKKASTCIIVAVSLLSLILMFPVTSVKASPDTYVSVINPTTGGYTVTLPPNTPPGTKFLVNLTITDVNVPDVNKPLRVWQVNLTWNPALLNISQIGPVSDPETGDLFAPSDHVFHYSQLWSDKVVDNTFGNLFWMCSLKTASAKGFNGSGTLCQVRFTTVKDGTTEPTTCTIKIVTTGAIKTKLVGPIIGGVAYLIPFTARDGTYIIPEFSTLFTAVILLTTLVAFALGKIAWSQKRWRRLIAT